MMYVLMLSLLRGVVCPEISHSDDIRNPIISFNFLLNLNICIQIISFVLTWLQEGIYLDLKLLIK